MSKPHMRAARGSATTGYAEEQCLALRGVLRELGPVLVAFSGGVDSAVLLSAALEELGPEGVLAVTAHGDVHTGEGLDAATSTASRLGASHRIVPTHELSIPGFAANFARTLLPVQARLVLRVGRAGARPWYRFSGGWGQRGRSRRLSTGAEGCRGVRGA